MLLRLSALLVSFTPLLSAMHPIPSLTNLCLKTISNHELDSSKLSQHYKQFIKEGLIRHNGFAVWAAATDKLENSLWRNDPQDLVSLSADGSFIVIASCNNTANVWDLKMGEFIYSLVGHADAITSIAIAPDNSYIVTGSRDTTARLWDTKTSKCLCTLSGHSDVVTSVAITGPDRQIVSGSLDTTAKVWNGYTGKVIHTLRGHNTPVSVAANFLRGFPMSSYHIVTRSDDNEVKVWNHKTGECIRALSGGLAKILYTAAKEQMFWPVATNNRRSFCVAIDPKDATVAVYDLTIGGNQLWYKINDLTAVVAISSDSKLIITGSYNKAVKIWDAKTGKLIQSLSTESPIELVKVNKGNTCIVAKCKDGQVRVWSRSTGELFKNTPKIIDQQKISSNGTLIASVSKADGNKVEVYNAKTRELIHLLGGHEGEVTAVAISHDGSIIVTGSRNGEVKLWAMTTGKSSVALHGLSPIKAIKLTDGNSFFTMKVICEAGHEIRRFGNMKTVSNDGTFIVSVPNDVNIVSKLEIYNAKTKELAHTLNGHTGGILSVVISPDDTFIVTGSCDQTIKIWDAKTKKCIHTLDLQSLGQGYQIIESIGIAADNTYITIGCDKCVYLWKITSFVNSLLDEKISPEDVLKIINTHSSDSSGKGYCAIQ
jgi:WD40 repeat protein